MAQESKPVKAEERPSEGQGRALAVLSHRRGWLGVGIVVLVTAFLYAPAMNHPFTNWDDEAQITDNPDIRDLSPQSIEKMFSTFYVQLYQPLTSLGFALEYRLFGLNPHAYHTVNILLHLVNILLVFVLIRALAQNAGVALAVAALFAVHPLQVEVAAWASSLGIVLCSAFYLGTLIVYVAYVRSGRRRYYVAALALFLLALLAKTWAVTLPLVLLVLDFYLQRDLSRTCALPADEGDLPVTTSRADVLGMTRGWAAWLYERLRGRGVYEKVPFFLLAFAFGCITMVARSGLSRTQDLGLEFSLVQRLCIACYCCLWYVGKLIFPVGLSVYYPFPEKANGWLPVTYYLAPVLLLGLVVAIGHAGRYRRLLAFAGLFMLASLLMVVQIVPISHLMVCDRYAYIPCIGLFFLAAMLGHQMSARAWFWRKAIPVAVVVLALLSGATYRRVGVWRDSVTLWSDAISKRRDIGAAYLNRGLAEFDQGDYQAAIADFDATLRLNYQPEKVLHNRALSRMYAGDLPGALRDFDAAIRLNPGDSGYRLNRGLLKRDMGDPAGALRDFEAALALDARNTKALCGRADISWGQGERSKAIADYEAVLRLDPNHVYAMLSLGAALVDTGDYERALSLLNQALARGYQARPVYALLARAYQETGQVDLANEALRHAQEAGHGGAQTPHKENSPRS